MGRSGSARRASPLIPGKDNMQVDIEADKRDLQTYLF